MNIKGFSEIGAADGVRSIRPEGLRGGKRGGTRERESAEQVTLTQATQRLAEASRSAAENAPVDRSRVDSIRAAIAEGRYPVDPSRVAGKLLAAEIALGGRDAE
ncbi:MAG TPA: flagellar biosynthesis anti-sigma factor FlgM [Gammaproteobacteria bacterium]|nr:flagellar biosynthesis anti-sigma factor FlgM [Gammaproteobacteria bacterium]